MRRPGRVAYQGHYFSIHLDSGGTEFVYTGDEVLVVPLDEDGRVILTEEPSAAFGESVLILPGGEVEADESHAETANRELQEEIGCRADRLDFLGEIRPYSKYLTVRSFLYLARDLMPSRLPADEGYTIILQPVSLTEFESLVEDGRLRDARAIAALYMVRSLV